MEKRETNNRTEAWNVVAFVLAIPLIALALTKIKPQINVINIAESKTDDNIDDMDKPKNGDQIEAEEVVKLEMNDRKEATDRAVYCFGTTRLLEKRREKYKLLNKIIKFTGISIPISLGFFATSPKIAALIPTLEPVIMPILLSITAFLNIALLYLSVWALVDEWDAKIEIYTDSISNNMQYFKVFKEIAERYIENPTDYSAKLKEMILLDDVQQKQDGKENFSNKDYRHITRLGLHQLHLPCPNCKKVPSLEKTKTCETCGI